ncbi:MAG: hypothetical protein LUD01_00460, partial [Clostridiales bacterium]|nr:hypothetical protein [Clostridiales bacterium]
MEEGVAKEYQERAKIYTCLVILMWRKPLQNIVQEPFKLLRQWGDYKVIDVSKENNPVFPFGRGTGRFTQKLLYNGSNEQAAFTLDVLALTRRSPVKWIE